MVQEPKFIIVIGASAGGLNALCEVVAQLHEDIDAAIFVVLHLSRRGIGDYLRHRLQQNTVLRCSVVAEEMPIERGHIYVAVPDYHLIVKKGVCKVGDGVEENRWRPSIDVLFRSAAVAYGERVIGVILTGLMDDGTAGMIAIKRCGGLSVVQDPNEAEYPEMPLSVLNNISVDYSLPLSQIGYVLFQFMETKQFLDTPVPEDVIREAEIAEKVATGIDVVQQVSEGQAVYSCPDCGGSLWELGEIGQRRFRCHIGHVYTELDLLIKEQETIEKTLWVALRMMEERKHLLNRLASESTSKGLLTMARDHKKRAGDLQNHIDILKGILFKIKID